MELPPYFKYEAGAHVSVMVKGDIEKTGPLAIKELGEKIPFNIVSTHSLKPEGWRGVNEVSFLTVNAPKLESIRKKYGLTPKISGDHDFHITYLIRRESCQRKAL